MIFWWIALFAFFNHLLICTQLLIKILVNRLNRPSHQVRESLKRLLIPDLFWLPSILGPGFDLSILVHNESFTSLQHHQWIFVSLQLLYLVALVGPRVVRAVWDWDRAKWHSKLRPSDRTQWRAILSVIMLAVVCLISFLSCVCFVIILLIFPHSKAENASWPYVARHNRALRLIFLAPVWASWLSRCPLLLPTQASRPLLIADYLVFVSSSVVAGISSYYATKNGPEQLICFTALNSVYMVHDHFALLFWHYSSQLIRLQSNSRSHHSARSLQASEEGILPNQDSQTSQQPWLLREPNIASDS